jgi:pantoate--beta-alanine ligase
MSATGVGLVGAGGLTALAGSRAELAAARAAMTGRVAVVMTMGALHAGHAELIRRARAGADHVIVTIFVNPLQFGPAEDFDRYPRTLEADLRVCRNEGVDLVFAPGREEIYPGGEPSVRVDAGRLGSTLEGASRPGHFDGVLTVVLKLLNLTRPGRAYFGEKDYQQLTLIRAMIRDLDLGVEIIGVETVREPDGLALSSRNRYLSAPQRNAALALSRALRAGAAAADAGGDQVAVLAAARARLGGVAPAEGAVRADGTASVEIDYLELTDEWLGPAPRSGPARLLVAARVGTTRLIDNVGLRL